MPSSIPELAYVRLSRQHLAIFLKNLYKRAVVMVNCTD